MSEGQVKSKLKKNTKIKYEVSKPTFLMPSKIDKFLQKKPKKEKNDIGSNNQKKIFQIKKKINLLQEQLAKNKSPLIQNNQKSSLSKDKFKKHYNNEKKSNISIDKDTLSINQKSNNYHNIKPSYQPFSDNIFKKHALINSFNTKFDSEHDQQLNDLFNYNGLKYNKDFYNKMIKDNINMYKSIIIEDDYSHELTHREKGTKIRNNNNYSMDKENTSIDKSINFNHLREYKKGKNKKNRSAKNIIYPYNKSGDIKIVKKNIENLKNTSYSKNKFDKNVPQSLKMIDEEMNILPVKYKSIVTSKKKIIRKEIIPNNEQNEVRHLENISKETPSTKNTIKTETRTVDNVLNYKNSNNKFGTVELSINHLGRKKESLNRSVNKILSSTNRHKMIKNTSIKYIYENKNNSKKNYSFENRNEYGNLSKAKNHNTNNNNNNNKISQKLTNNSNPNVFELNNSPLIKNNNINLPSNKNTTKNLISLKKSPMKNQFNLNSPKVLSNNKKDYDSTVDIIKKVNIYKNQQKHSSFNLSRANLNQNQNNNPKNNIAKNNSNIKNKTEKNSKTNTYKIKDKINDNINSSNEQKKSTDLKEEEKEGVEKDCIPHVYSVTIRQGGFKQKEYPNMAKRLSSSQYDISIKDPLYENLKMSKIVFKEKKSIKLIESLCKKGFSGPGIKKTNQDNFFIFNNFNNNSNYIYMGVCDGHGIFGQDISSYLVNNLPQNLNNEFINKNIKNLSMEKLFTLNPILESTFKQTNINLNTDERIDSTFSGSTCVTALFTPTRLICINVGDSRCIMGKLNNNKWTSKNLTRDHKPSEPDEMDRIIAAGGYVEPYRDNDGNFVGPERVWKKEEDGPGLAMSRSFGDEIAHCVGVIVNPEINEYQFLNEDKFFILASDGLWEFISSEEVVNIVKDFYLENDIEGAITYLYKEASKRWIMEEEVIDDITIILVFLN